MKLANATPEEWYRFLKDNGYDPKPLGKGNFRNIPFEEGGGFIVHWGGDRILQYHPPGRTHHGADAYWKLSSGPTGTKRFNLNGTLKLD